MSRKKSIINQLGSLFQTISDDAREKADKAKTAKARKRNRNAADAASFGASFTDFIGSMMSDDETERSENDDQDSSPESDDSIPWQDLGMTAMMIDGETDEEILAMAESRYRQMCAKYHPDKSQGDQERIKRNGEIIRRAVDAIAQIRAKYGP